MDCISFTASKVSRPVPFSTLSRVPAYMLSKVPSSARVAHLKLIQIVDRDGFVAPAQSARQIRSRG